ncbi:MAG TPA: ABC transporter ATP-binding protein [Syntrophorhabdaceae bacterium]|nr:ABC transporter ATP-binding protein [Syntrophorhabdaceae bacterium]
MTTILEARSLSVHYQTPVGAVKALDHASFSLGEGEILGMVGHSGSGKTTAACVIGGFLEKNGRVENGEVLFRGENILFLPWRRRRRILGKGIFLIMQNSASALNPTRRVIAHVADACSSGEAIMGRKAVSKACALLERVGIGKDKQTLFPFQLSGGTKQRVLIAMALALRPAVLIADEPTAGLDAINQATVLDLFGTLKEESVASVILITHDLRVLTAIADRIAVMYRGALVETSNTADIISKPVHRHTQELVNAMKTIHGS